MRILILTILFFGPLYYFHQKDTVVSPDISIDSIKLKMGAPNRELAEERILTNKDTELDVHEKPTEIIDEDRPEHGLAEILDLEHAEEYQLNDLDDGWSNELKDMLSRLEPADGEQIHKTYMALQESYQTELDALINEKQLKDSDDAMMEVDYMIGQLEQSHQYKLKEVLGAHYEAVRDHYDYYMEITQYNQ